jgi:hypothetical protein
MAAGRPYGEFYDFCTVNPEYFGYILVAERYTMLHCTVPLDLTSGSGFDTAA